MIDGHAYKFEVGQAYEINKQLIHSVMNKGAEDRNSHIFTVLRRVKTNKLQA